jgi:hypothetical protein
MRSYVSALLPLVIVLFSCQQTPSASSSAATTSSTPPASSPSPVERGHMLVIGGGCHDCHTPKTMTPTGPQPDMSRMLSGHPESDKIDAPFKPQGKWTAATNDHLTAWGGPWGVSFAANLTPDQNSGLGVWTEEMFVNAIKTGKHMGTSRPILPPMPWPWYSQLSDADLKAIYAYLRTIPPVTNHVPPPIGPDGKSIQ